MICYNTNKFPRFDLFMFTERNFYWPQSGYSFLAGGWESPKSITKDMVAVGPKVLTEWRDGEV